MIGKKKSSFPPSFPPPSSYIKSHLFPSLCVWHTSYVTNILVATISIRHLKLILTTELSLDSPPWWRNDHRFPQIPQFSHKTLKWPPPTTAHSAPTLSKTREWAETEDPRDEVERMNKVKVSGSLYHMNSLERVKENAGPASSQARPRDMRWEGSSPAWNTLKLWMWKKCCVTTWVSFKHLERHQQKWETPYTHTHISRWYMTENHTVF